MRLVALLQQENNVSANCVLDMPSSSGDIKDLGDLIRTLLCRRKIKDHSFVPTILFLTEHGRSILVLLQQCHALPTVCMFTLIDPSSPALHLTPQPLASMLCTICGLSVETHDISNKQHIVRYNLLDHERHIVASGFHLVRPFLVIKVQ
jgi:hypothetical protein